MSTWELKSPELVVSLAVVVSAIIAIAVHYLRPPRPWLVYVSKPLTTGLILVAAVLPRSSLTHPYGGAIALGLLFSLVGDIWLMLPGDHFFYGLVCFLLTHLCYAFAFITRSFGYGFPWAVIPALLMGGMILRYLWPDLAPALKGPVCLYVGVIVAMAGFSVHQALARTSIGALSAVGGAMLFLASDALLAINHFRKPFYLVHVAVLSTYFVGQLLIALSVGL